MRLTFGAVLSLFLCRCKRAVTGGQPAYRLSSYRFMMARRLCLLLSLIKVTIIEFYNGLGTIRDQGIPYFVKHLLCVVHLTFKTRVTALRFPIPEPVIQNLNPESAGYFHSDHEWKQERPKTEEHLQENEDTLLFQGSHIRSGSSLVLCLSRLQSRLCEVFIALQLESGRSLVLENNVKLDLSDELSYYGCGLKLECLAPMRRWRLCFNGLMRNQNDELIHVKFGGIWMAGSHTVEHPLAVPISTISDSLSHFPSLILASHLDSIYNKEFSISQYGRVDLEVTVGREDPVEIHLWGSRMNRSGKRQRGIEYHKFAHFRPGHRFHVTSRKFLDTSIKTGSVYDPMTKAYAITSAEISSSNISVSNGVEKFEIQIGRMTLHPLSLSATHPKVNDNLTLHIEEASLNGERGMVITLRAETHDRPMLPVPLEYKHHMVDSCNSVSELALPTSNENCKRADLTGGKGSSLAVLTSISNQFGNFAVPRAIVLTTAAYDMFSKVRKVQDSIQALSAVVRRNPRSEDLEAACGLCVSVIESSRVPAKITRKLREQMTVFGDLSKLRFAIRSSAVSEDSEQMSAAGQMTTSLGVLGSDFKSLVTSVAKCWASQFSFAAVNYKRQFGQLVASRMAVVVQEMVPSQTSGVMFTCDPVTSSPEIIIITANYGLGESVVSASAEPDIFKVRRSPSGRMKVDSVVVGKKSSLIEQDDTGGTVERDVVEEDRQKACISEEVAEKVALIGHQIESCFTTARNIEWALVNDQIHVLQSRPVASTTKESDFEIISDNNGNIKSEDEILSRAIVGELFPGAMSPLGTQLVGDLFGILCRDIMINWKPIDEVELSIYPGSLLPAVRKQVYFSASERDVKDSTQRALMYALYGRDISKEEPVRIGVSRMKRRPKSLSQTLKQAIGMLSLLFPTKVYEDVSERSKEFEVYQNENLTASQQLLYIVNSILQMGVFSAGFFRGFVETSMFNLFVMNTLSNANKGEIDTKVLTATAELIQAGDIESVDVPLSLQRLGAGLSKSPDREKFLAMEPEEALEWLMGSQGTDGQRFHEFLQKHGHRCVKEFDVASEPWSMRPATLIKSLQVAAREPHEPKALANIDYDLSRLGLELSVAQRLLLRFLVPKARQAVVNREIAKSATIRAVHKVRIAFLHLAELMVDEGRLPDEQLIFFMELDEIHRLIQTRNPAIVARAVRRRRLHSRLDNEKYPVLQCGFPKMKEPMTFANSLMELKGTPVCQGIIQGRARVIKHFETEAHLIDKDEILITTATDTGWTPYFPILGGVVTESGGLSSHGAVVAREYGLPCVAGIENATQIFSSGDLVRIDGGKGTLQKVSEASME